MNIWFTSDLHFGHRNILKFCAESRPFADTDEMDTKIIDRINESVMPNHDFYILGDFSFHRDQAKNQELFDRINGRKHLIIGNHDDKEIFGLGWESVSHLKEIRHNDQKIVLCHYPMEHWNKSHRGSLHLYGHVHSQKGNPKTIETIPNRHDAGWDRNMRPIHVDEIIKHFETPFL